MEESVLSHKRRKAGFEVQQADLQHLLLDDAHEAKRVKLTTPEDHGSTSNGLHDEIPRYVSNTGNVVGLRGNADHLVFRDVDAVATALVGAKRAILDGDSEFEHELRGEETRAPLQVKRSITPDYLVGDLSRFLSPFPPTPPKEQHYPKIKTEWPVTHVDFLSEIRTKPQAHVTQRTCTSCFEEYYSMDIVACPTCYGGWCKGCLKTLFYASSSSSTPFSPLCSGNPLSPDACRMLLPQDLLQQYGGVKLEHANLTVDTNPVARDASIHAPAEQKPAMVQYQYQVLPNLEENHKCHHNYWLRLKGSHQCEECLDTLRFFIYECRRCRSFACRRCRYNQLT